MNCCFKIKSHLSPLFQHTIICMKYFFSILALILLFSCGSSDIKSETDTYKKAKESLSDKEKKNPLKFLSVTGDDKKNLIGQTVINGNVTNTATVIAYKDIRIKMLSYKDGKMVEEHEDVIDDLVKPGNTKNFKTRYRLPKGTDSIALSVMSAVVADMEKDKK